MVAVYPVQQTQQKISMIMKFAKISRKSAKTKMESGMRIHVSADLTCFKTAKKVTKTVRLD
jgi:hypothetical protein